MSMIDRIFARLEVESGVPSGEPTKAAALVGLGLVAIAYAITTLRREVV